MMNKFLKIIFTWLLAFFFWGIMTPINIFLSLLGHDPLKTRSCKYKTLFTPADVQKIKYYLAKRRFYFFKQSKMENTQAPDTVYPMW